jgi:hypothetical protein
MLNWLDQEALLSSAALTVRAQAINVNDRGLFYHPFLFPRVDARSVKISEITSLDLRMAADRREWNTRGRQIPLVMPGTKEIEMIPVESYFKVEEREMQAILEGANGNEAVFRDIVRPTIGPRTDDLTVANFRRIEIDAMKAWATGTIVVRNPQGSGADKTVSFSFAGSRYVTPTAWNATPNDANAAYTQLLTQAYNAQTLIGPLSGAVMRLSTWRAVQATAPLASALGQVVPLSRREIERRLSEELGAPFQIIVIEDTHEVFTDGGTARTSVAVWESGRVAFMPAGRPIGNTHYAPVVRAFQLASANPSAQIDVRGMTVVREVGNGGRDLTVECQVNALAIPNEQSLYVVNAQI